MTQNASLSGSASGTGGGTGSGEGPPLCALVLSEKGDASTFIHFRRPGRISAASRLSAGRRRSGRGGERRSHNSSRSGSGSSSGSGGPACPAALQQHLWLGTQQRPVLLRQYVVDAAPVREAHQASEQLLQELALGGLRGQLRNPGPPGGGDGGSSVTQAYMEGGVGGRQLRNPGSPRGRRAGRK